MTSPPAHSPKPPQPSQPASPPTTAPAGKGHKRLDLQRIPAGWDFVLIAVLAIAVHNDALKDRLVFDDHWHYHTVRTCDWSLNGLFNATTIDTQELFHAWWQEKPVVFQYTRPVAVALMKATYLLSGDRPAVAHLVSLLLHALACLLVRQLVWSLTRQRAWALVAALIFATYELSLYAVAWLAAQNMVLQTVLTLAALVCYVHASGLRADIRPALIPKLKTGWAAVGFVCWILALFTRENAILLPPIIASLDLGLGGWRWLKQRWWVHTVSIAAGLIFIAWRMQWASHPIPEGYVYRGEGLAYLVWLVTKLFHYLCTVVWLAPMVVGPSGRYAPLQEAPFDVALTVGIVAMVVIIYAFAARGTRGAWIWPLWIVCAVLPVTPVLATPHTGYLCGVGVAVGLAWGPALSPRRWNKIFAVMLGIGGALFLRVNDLLWRGMIKAERAGQHALLHAPPPAEAEHLFFINLPFTSAYVDRHLTEMGYAGLDDRQTHVLTFAPDLVRMEQPCTLEQRDAHSFVLRVGGRGYFSGLLGRFLINGFRDSGRLTTGQVIESDPFDVTVVDATTDGVHALRFRFEKPLTDPDYCFYITSERTGALRYYFRGPSAESTMLLDDVFAEAAPAELDLKIRSGVVAAITPLLDALDLDEPAQEQDACTALQDTVQSLCIALASPVDPAGFEDDCRTLDRLTLQRWWLDHVRPDQCKFFFNFDIRERQDRLAHRRDELRRGPDRVRRFIRADLYLTGRPFPGPR